MRDNFTDRTKRVIQDRAGNRCSNPDCRVLTSGPNAHPEKSTKTGVAAHITAASLGGPRYNPHLITDQRQSAENGIWLCQTCAHFVDTDYLNYPVALLNKWKAQAESEADDETKGRKAHILQPTSPEPYQIEGWCCPFCGTVVEFGKYVCLGCHAEVVPGLTQHERQEAAKTGMMFGGLIAFVVLFLVPDWIRSFVGWNITNFFGLGIYAFAVAAIMVFAGGILVVRLSEKIRLREPPRFFRHSIR